LYIDIRYAVGETNDPRNLVFPFYVIPPETS
ncbi:MAG: baseplate protein, partial [Chloroflexi bacterium]